MSKFIPDMHQKVDLRKWVNPETTTGGYDFVEIDRFDTLDDAHAWIAHEKEVLLNHLFEKGEMDFFEILEYADAFVESFHTVLV